MNTQTYNIQGMTCSGCSQSVQDALLGLPQVTEAKVSLTKNQATVTAKKPLKLENLQEVLSPKYSITKQTIIKEQESKLKQLRPLLLIFLFIGTAAVLLHIEPVNYTSMMLDFMGLFFIVFSFFKLLDLKGFPASFAMYDPLAKVVPAYGWVYPFVELALGLAFLMRVQLLAAVIITVVILGITTIGVLRTLLGKKQIRCACLGTALKLPMTEATLIENVVMLVMSVLLIVNQEVL